MYAFYENRLFQSVSLCGLVDFATQRLLNQIWPASKNDKRQK